MSPDNIVNKNNILNSKISHTFGSKGSSTSFSGAYYAQKKSKKALKQEQIQPETAFETSKGLWREFLDKIILFFLTIIGKQKEWLEAKKNLQKIQHRINQFENVLQDSKTTKLKMPHHRDFKV